jgi:hypothetical protein
MSTIQQNQNNPVSLVSIIALIIIYLWLCYGCNTYKHMITVHPSGTYWTGKGLIVFKKDSLQTVNK